MEVTNNDDSSLTSEFEFKITSEITDIQLIVKKERFINYTIKTTYPKNKQYIVERRYSDFEWLRKTLVTEYSDKIIPIIPEKDMLGKFSPDVIAYRKRTLNSFLQKLLSDSTWANDKNIERFLKDSDQGFETSLEKSGSFFSSLFSAVETLANETVTIPEDAVEEWFNDKAKYVSDLADNFKNIKLIRESIVEAEKKKLKRTQCYQIVL